MTTRLEQIHALLKSIETGDPGPVAVVNEARYVQHNPQTHEGSEGLASLFKKLSKTEPRVTMVRGFEDGDFVVAHMEYDFSRPKVCFEVFRFEDGRAVEHWDNLQDRAGPNRSGHDMVAGPTEITDLPATEANRNRVRAFVEEVLIGKALHRFDHHVDTARFTEHNPVLGDDVTALLASLRGSEAGGPPVDYRRLHRVLARGCFVLTQAEGLANGGPAAFYDLFRLEDGHIVEHWDTTESIAPRSEWKNDNGKF